MLELSDGENLSSIELDTGNTIVARILKEDSSGVTVQQNGGIQATFSEDQVVDIKPLSEAKYRRGLKQEFRQRLGKVDSKLYFDIFSVALYAIQNKLHDEITPILEQTFNLPGSELVLQTFYTRLFRFERFRNIRLKGPQFPDGDLLISHPGHHQRFPLLPASTPCDRQNHPDRNHSQRTFHPYPLSESLKCKKSAENIEHSISRFTVYGLRFTFHALRSTLYALRSTLYALRFTHSSFP